MRFSRAVHRTFWANLLFGTSDDGSNIAWIERVFALEGLPYTQCRSIREAFDHEVQRNLIERNIGDKVLLPLFTAKLKHGNESASEVTMNIWSDVLGFKHSILRGRSDGITVKIEPLVMLDDGPQTVCRLLISAFLSHR